MRKKKLTKTEKRLSGTYLGSHKELTDKIQMYLAIVQCFIKKQNQLGYFDINKTCEYVFCKILNIVYGINLIDLNKAFNTNFPAIDLGDQKSRICYQITSENSATKIKQTICKFQELKFYKQYSELYFLLLSPKRTLRKPIEYMNQSYKMLVTDFTDLEKEITRRCDHARMQNIIDILQREIIRSDYGGIKSIADYLNNRNPIPKYGDNYNRILGGFDEETKKDYVRLIHEFADNIMKYSKDIRKVICIICVLRLRKNIQLNCEKRVYFLPERICRELKNSNLSITSILRELIQEGRICESDYCGIYILDFYNRKHGIDILSEILNKISKEEKFKDILEEIIVNIDFTFLDDNDDK